MNAKKIIKGIVGLGVMSGVAYLAYKIGESNGEINERYRDKGDEDIDIDNEEDNLSYDEPDDGCVAPSDNADCYHYESINNSNLYGDDETKLTKQDVLRKYEPFESIYIAGAEQSKLRILLLHLAITKYFTRKEVINYFGGDEDIADEVLRKYEYAGYIKKYDKYKFRCLLTTEEYCRLVE